MQRAILTDFGLAKDASTGSKYTRTGLALGTPAYMSPEQARGETAALTPATDVWALGVVAYELLAGRPPFEGGASAELVAGILAAEPTPLRAIRADLPRGVIAVVAAALAKDPRHRPADGAALRDALDQVLRGERPRLPGRRRRPLATTAAILVAAAAVTVAVAARPAPAPEATNVPTAATQAEALAARAREGRSLDPAAAARTLEGALRLAPGRDDWQVELGLLRWLSGDGEGARAAWEAVPTGAPGARRARLYHALEVVFRGVSRGTNVERDALDALTAAAVGADGTAVLARAMRAALDERWPDAQALLAGLTSWEGLALRGYVESRRPGGDVDAALHAFDATVAAGFPFAWVYGARGALRARREDLGGALADLDASLRLVPGDRWVLTNRAIAHLRRRDFAAARLDAEAALAGSPGFPSALATRGQARAELGDPRGGLEDLDESLRTPPPGGSIHLVRARVRKRIGDRVGARADFDEALRREPDLVDAWNDRGTLRDEEGDHTGAEADFTAALALAPDRFGTWMNRATTRFQRGDLRGGEADVTAALAMQQDDAYAWTLRGVLRATAGNFAGARADLETAVRLDPAHVDAWLNLGRACADGGDPAAAVTAFRECLRLAPDGPDAEGARARLAACEAAAGR